MVTRSTRGGPAAAESRVCSSRAVVLLPTATLPATAMTNGTFAVVLPRNSACAAHSRRLAATCRSSSSASGQVDGGDLVEVDPVAERGQPAQLRLVQRQRVPAARARHEARSNTA